MRCGAARSSAGPRCGQPIGRGARARRPVHPLRLPRGEHHGARTRLGARARGGADVRACARACVRACSGTWWRTLSGCASTWVWTAGWSTAARGAARWRWRTASATPNGCVRGCARAAGEPAGAGMAWHAAPHARGAHCRSAQVVGLVLRGVFTLRREELLWYAVCLAAHGLGGQSR
jgi:hypothetical protein